MNNDLVYTTKGDRWAIVLSFLALLGLGLVMILAPTQTEASVQPAMPSEISEAPTP